MKTAKRKYGTGNIQQLPNGKWRGRIYYNGKRLSFMSITKREVEKWIKTVRQNSIDIDNGEYIKRRNEGIVSELVQQECGFDIEPGEDINQKRSNNPYSYYDIVNCKVINNDENCLAMTTKNIFKNRVGYIYFIEQTSADAIKIGFAAQPKKRFRVLQIGNPNILRLCFSLAGDLILENQLHIRFSKYRIRPDGEWFRNKKEIEEELKKDYPLIYDLENRMIK